MAGPGLRTAAVPALVGALWRRSGVGTTSHCSCGGTARALGDARRRRRSRWRRDSQNRGPMLDGLSPRARAAAARRLATTRVMTRCQSGSLRESRGIAARTIRPDDQHSSAVDEMILKLFGSYIAQEYK